jgi:hypothetical protein
MAHTRICCPSCKTRFRVPTMLRTKASRCPRCRVKLVLQSAGGTTTALLAPAVTHGAPQQAPAAPSRVSPVGDTAVDVPASGPTRWDKHALAWGSSRP